jgi:prephenate dehydrogenase
MNVSIIGYGRLGKLLAKYLAQDFTVNVHDLPDVLNSSKQEIERIGAKTSSIDEACNSHIIIPCVPISEFESVIEKIKDNLKPGTLVADVCSVKEHPVNVMKKLLPKEVQILGTHPMFGPDSAAKTLFGTKTVFCKERIEDRLYEGIKSYFQDHGMHVIEVTTEEHDRQISHSLLLSHMLGRTLIDIKAKRLDIETLGYRRLMKILGTVENDTWQLFEDMNRFNRFAGDARKEFIDALLELDGRLK